MTEPSTMTNNHDTEGPIAIALYPKEQAFLLPEEMQAEAIYAFSSKEEARMWFEENAPNFEDGTVAVFL